MECAFVCLLFSAMCHTNPKHKAHSTGCDTGTAQVTQPSGGIQRRTPSRPRAVRAVVHSVTAVVVVVIAFAVAG